MAVTRQCLAGDGAVTAATRQCLRPVAAAPSPVGGTAGAGSPLRRPGRESAPGAGIRSMPNLHNFAARPVELQLHIRTGAGQWYSQEQAIQAQPCGFAALQHERNHPVPLLEAGSASTHLAASVPLLFVFPRTFAA